MTTEGTPLTGTQPGAASQREAEARLRDSLSLLEAVTNSTADAVFVKDREGRYVLANPAVCALFGVPDGGVVGRTDFDFLPEGEARRLRENDKEIMSSGAPQVYEEEVTVVPVAPVVAVPPEAAGGAGRRVFQVTKSPWRDPATGDILGVVGIAQDVTERVVAQRELAHREREYAALVDNSPDVLARYDRDKRMVSVNRAGERHSGMAASSLVGKTFREAGFPEEIIPVWDAALDRVLQTGQPHTIAFSLPFPSDGTIRHYESVFSPEFPPQSSSTVTAGQWGADGVRADGVIAVTRDVTERRRAEREAHERAQEVVTVFESMTDAFYALDGGWRFTYLNAEAERLLRRTRGELMGRVVWDEFPEAARARFGGEYRRAVREGVPITVEEFYPPLDTWFEIRAFPTRAGAGAGGGAGAGLSVYFRNVTKRRRAEQERERLLGEQQRLVSELREAGVRQRRFLKEMLAGFTEGRLRLCFSEGELRAPLPPMSEALELSDDALRPLRKRVQVAADGLGLPKERVQGFATAVHEAAVNAVKHGGGGSARIHGDSDVGTLQVWVQDQGPGIAEEMIHRAVEQGYTTQGFGHGMFFMQSCADRLYLLSEAGRGTTIVLEMDRQAPEPAWLRSGG